MSPGEIRRRVEERVAALAEGLRSESLPEVRACLKTMLEKAAVGPDGAIEVTGTYAWVFRGADGVCTPYGEGDRASFRTVDFSYSVTRSRVVLRVA